MAVSKKPRKRKPQKRGGINKTLKDFKKMNSKEQFLSMYQDLDKITNDLSTLLDHIYTIKEPLSNEHQSLIEQAKEKRTLARSASVELFEKHYQIQKRKEEDENFTDADENLEYCLLGTDIFEHHNNLLSCYELLQPVVANLK